MKKECSSLKNFPDKLTPAALNDLLEKCFVCPGHPDKHFVEVAQCKKGELKSNDGKTVVATVDQYAPVYSMLVVKSIIVLLDVLNVQLLSKTK